MPQTELNIPYEQTPEAKSIMVWCRRRKLKMLIKPNKKVADPTNTTSIYYISFTQCSIHTVGFLFGSRIPCHLSIHVSHIAQMVGPTMDKQHFKECI